MILRVEKDDLKKYLDLIRESFQTVADEFGFTPNNCPGHTAFITLDRLERDYAFGNPMYVYQKDGCYAGFVSLRPREDESCEMKLLCVHPRYRHMGIGRVLAAHAKEVARDEFKVRKLTIGIIDESHALKAWYESMGFTMTGTQKFPHLPFRVGFMEMLL